MAWTRFSRTCATAALAMAMSLAACGGSDGPPRDPWEHLMTACTTYAEAICNKDAQCVPPEEATCMSTQLAGCLSDGQQGGPSCVPAAASAIEGCAASLTAMTCADYCTTDASGTFCFAPCVWLC
jgi:hypothetical protein